MPLDAPGQVRADPGFGTSAGSPVLYVLPATGADASEGEEAIAAELTALRGAGIRALPVAVLPSGRGAAGLAGDAILLPAEPLPRALHQPLAHPLRALRAGTILLAQRSLPAGHALRLGRALAAVAQRTGARHIHAAAADQAALAALLGARLAGVTVSVTGRGQEVLAAPADLLLKLRQADRVLAACADMAEAFRALARPRRLSILPAGVDELRFRPRPELPRNGRLLCAAPLLPRSGLSVLLAALAALAPGQRPVVDVIGAGPLMDPLRAEAMERGVSDHVRFLGARPPAWMAAEGPAYLGLVAPGIQAADGDCAPNPAAVAEAMAMGLPVIASALMGVKELLRPDAGHLVPPGQPQILAQAIGWLARMPEAHRRRMGEAGRAHILACHTLAHRGRALAAAIGG